VLSEGNNGQCQGQNSSVYLNVDVSGGQADFISWSQDCGQGATLDIDSQNNFQAVLNLTAPGLGQPVMCTVSASVSINEQIVNCEEDIQIAPCLIDCLGQINGSAQLDRCGKCNGDGQSCLGCEDTDITALLMALDGNAFKQKQVVRSAVKLQRKAANIRTLGKKSIEQADELYQQSWGLSWSIPKIAVKCVNTSFCVSIDNSGSIGQFLENSVKLKNLGVSIARKLLRSSSSSVRTAAKKLITQASKLHNGNIAKAKEVPSSTSSCI